MSLTDYLAKLVAADDTLVCTGCQQTDGLRIVLMAKGPAWAKIVCDHCDERYVRWAPKPDKKRPNRNPKSTGLLNVIRDAWGEEPLYCKTCLRDERYLPDDVWMVAHHVIEHQDGGADTASNLEPHCNECHGLIHWRRKTVHGAQVGKSEKELAHASR